MLYSIVCFKKGRDNRRYDTESARQKGVHSMVECHAHAATCAAGHEFEPERIKRP